METQNILQGNGNQPKYIIPIINSLYDRNRMAQESQSDKMTSTAKPTSTPIFVKKVVINKVILREKQWFD